MSTRTLAPRPFHRALAVAGVLSLLLVIPSAVAANTFRTTKLTLVAHDGLDPEDLRGAGEEVESGLERLADLIGAYEEFPEIRVHVYPTLESKGLATGYTLPAHAFSARGEVHAVRSSVAGGFEGELTFEVATVALKRRLGRPRMDALEMGLAVLTTDNWRGRGALHWAGCLAGLDDLRHLEVLVDNRQLRAQSKLVMRPLAGAFVSFLLGRWGQPEFLRRYATWRPTRDEVNALQSDWSRFLADLRERYLASAQRHDSRSEGIPSFQRGFCHAHEGYQIYNGYASRESDKALARLVSLGTNSVSITPFTYMRATHRPAAFPFSSGAGSENDESVIHAVLTAKRLGMAVMLKPHVWVRGSWPGAVEMKSEEDWGLFFEHYHRWIRHYALMAEMYDVEILCIGVELSRTTRLQPERWRELIRSLRTIYGGMLTYAANWGDEFESTTIWADLDFIGVNCYYPLSDSESATDADLRAGVEAAMRKIEEVGERHNQPVIITEVGFASSASPWIAPYERKRGVGVDAQAQARCYQAFFSGLVGRSRCAGVYWWKWPSFLGYGGPRHAGFTPNRKPAEDIVRRWYGEILAN